MMGEHLAARATRHIAYCGHDRGRRARRALSRASAEGLEAGGGDSEHVDALEGTGDASSGMAAFGRILKEYPNATRCFSARTYSPSARSIAGRADSRHLAARPTRHGAAMAISISRTIMTPALTTVQVSPTTIRAAAGGTGTAGAASRASDVADPVIQVPMRT